MDESKQEKQPRQCNPRNINHIYIDVVSGASEALHKLRMAIVRAPGDKQEKYRHNRATIRCLLDSYIDQLPIDQALDGINDAINYLAQKINRQRLSIEIKKGDWWADPADLIQSTEANSKAEDN